jgi:FtsX extracellular domain
VVKPRLLVVAAVGVVVVAAVVVIVLITGGSNEPAAIDDHCAVIDVGFPTDAEMTAAIEKLKSDPHVTDPVGETKKQGYERITRELAGQPDVLALTRPETFPAYVHVKPAPGMDREQLKGEFRSTYPTAIVRDACNVPTIPPAT